MSIEKFSKNRYQARCDHCGKQVDDGSDLEIIKYLEKQHMTACLALKSK